MLNHVRQTAQFIVFAIAILFHSRTSLVSRTWASNVRRVATDKLLMKVVGLARYFPADSEMQAVKAIMTPVIRPSSESRDIITDRLMKEVQDESDDLTPVSLQCNAVTLANTPITLLYV